MNIKTTINVLFRVVLLTTMTFVMSIQTAGAQTKDPVEEAFTRDQKKAYEENADVRKGGNLIGMAPQVAIPHFEKAANSSNPVVRRVAIISLGVCYNALKDYQKAEQLLLKLAQQGDAYAQDLLGSIYGVLKDNQKEVQWLTKAAKQGSSGAQFNLGVCYYNGEGVAKDYQKAVQWYTKAAEQGHDGA
ncbi:MAG: sel1 repeat family protein, partial [Bacteroidaceae bacterium]|nr:sel1 repeat family protein [Bacteroidaceae bacterium]